MTYESSDRCFMTISLSSSEKLSLPVHSYILNILVASAADNFDSLVTKLAHN